MGLEFDEFGAGVGAARNFDGSLRNTEMLGKKIQESGVGLAVVRIGAEVNCKRAV